jgi:ATP-dependent DNA helicase RecG
VFYWKKPVSKLLKTSFITGPADTSTDLHSKLIKDCFVNEEVTIAGTIEKKYMITRGRKRLEIIISDESDTLTGIFFGGIRYFDKIFKEGDYVVFSGKISFFKNKQIVHPEFDFIDSSSRIQSINTGRIIPLYHSTESLKSIGFDSRGFRRALRQVIDNYLEYIDDTLEQSLLDRNKLISLTEALNKIHFPESQKDVENARKRLAFNEMFFLQYYLSLKKYYFRKHNAVNSEPIKSDLYDSVIHKVPFTLTNHQVKALDEIRSDIEQPFPMNRLLQGDVGSGKTIVALLASLLITESGRQVAIMAPTEVLANQHFKNFTALLKGDIEIRLLTGTTSNNDKEKIYSGLEDGTVEIVIGTHALIQGVVVFKDLGLIVIDEQHRFGVRQRANLREKGSLAHLLVMTATPIPRSLSLTMYSDLDVSIIREKPAERMPVETMSFPDSRLSGVYNSMEKYISQGRQIFYVLPLIEESEKIDLKSPLMFTKA